MLFRSAKVLQCNEDTETIIATTKAISEKKIRDIKKSGAEVIITPSKNNKVDLSYLMKVLGEKKIDSILLEGGSNLNYSALQEGIVDKIFSFIAPKIIGGDSAKTPVGGEGIPYMRDAISLKDINICRFEDDVMIEANVGKEV